MCCLSLRAYSVVDSSRVSTFIVLSIHCITLSVRPTVRPSLCLSVVRRGKCDHITPTLSELHWLPIRQRVIFKVATITFKLRQHSQPTYLSDQLVDYIPNRPLRSASQQLLSSPNPLELCSHNVVLPQPLLTSGTVYQNTSDSVVT